MAHPMLARLLLSGLAAAQGAAAIKIDLSRSHATHPQWLPHARFHVVWQVFNLALLAAIELALLWWPLPAAAARFYLAAALTATTLVAFWGALAGMRLYAGALYDTNGIPPLQLRIGGRAFAVEMNLAAVVLGSIVLAASILLY